MTDIKAQVEAAVMARGGKKEGVEIRFQCPNSTAHKHDDASPSANYNPSKSVWICRACGESGNYWHLGRLLGVINSGHRTNGFKETRRWDIGGMATHKRLERAGAKKLVEWERKGKAGLDGLPTADLPLYAAELLPDNGADVLVSEGEKSTDTLLAIGFAAVGTVTGATGTPSVESLEPLAGCKGRVFLCQDNDQAGRDHMSRVAARLKRFGKVVYIVDWPDVPEKGDAYDYIAAGHPAEDVQAVLDAAPLYEGEAEPEPEQALPEIITTGRHLRDITTDALSALYKGNIPPHIFRRSGALTRISTDEKWRPFTETLSESALRGKLDRAANFMRISEKGESHPITPPLDVTRDVESLGGWDFPPLAGITEAPVLRPDGTVLIEPGYDVATGLYYVPAPGLTVPPIPAAPTDGELTMAIEIVREVLCDFPFDSEASRANGYGALIAPVIRPAIEGPAPLPIIDKPQPGSGASLIADVISIISTGHLAATMGVPQSEEEWEKKLSSHLLAGRSSCVIDNIEGKLYSDTLSRYLTSTHVSIRPLGRSADIILTNNMTFIATGNNIRLGGDMPRRCYWVRLDAGVARPWLREANFKHPELREWVFANRGTILAAVLTITQGWITAGRPIPDGLPMLGGFENYCRTTGGVLAFMGVGGFLNNLFSMYDKMDADTPQWEGFLEMWREVIGAVPVTVAELVKRLNGSEDLAATLPDTLVTRDGRDYSRRLGNALAKRNEVRLPNGLMVQKAGTRKHAITWAAVSYQNANSPIFNYQSELGELTDTPAHKRMEDISLYKSRVEINSLNSPLATKEGELADTDSPAELPYCPDCGRNKWTHSPNGALVCPCGTSVKGGELC